MGVGWARKKSLLSPPKKTLKPLNFIQSVAGEAGHSGALTGEGGGGMRSEPDGKKCRKMRKCRKYRKCGKMPKNVDRNLYPTHLLGGGATWRLVS